MLTYTSLARQLAARRPLLRPAPSGRLAQLESALVAEENNLRKEDRAYWSPLLEELEALRHPK
jgi:hypothetical protein